jgi:hypothetical protein
MIAILMIRPAEGLAFKDFVVGDGRFIKKFRLIDTDGKMEDSPTADLKEGTGYSALPRSPVAVIGDNYLPQARTAEGNPGLLQNGSIDNLLAGEKIPTLDPLGLDEATNYFRKNYIPAVAELTGKTYISHLAKPSALDFDRSSLSRLVSEYGLKSELEEIRQELGQTEKGKDVPAELMDPIVKRVVREAIAGNYFGLNDATERFKDIYVNNLARYFGESEAARILNVTTRTVVNRVESYLSDERNRLMFPDDKIVEPNLEQIAEAIDSSTKKQAKEETKLWEQQKMQDTLLP